MALTKLNNKAVANVTSIPVALGDMVLVSSATASSSASIEFSLGNYKEYQIFFVGLHPQSDTTYLRLWGSTDGGSTYGVTKTTTHFTAQHNEADNSAILQYQTSHDLAQSTSHQNLTTVQGNDNDQTCSGWLKIFNPSSTTYVKHFMSCINQAQYDDRTHQHFVAGYWNTTSAINAVKFEFNTGNIDAGKILMFGLN